MNMRSQQWLTNAAIMPYEITLVASLDELASLRLAWRDLEVRSNPATTAFQSFDWVYQWSQSHADHIKSGQHEICVLLGHRSGRLVFAMPLMKRRKRAMKLLCWLTDPSGQYGDILCDADEQPQPWLHAALEYLKHHSGADILYLRHVRADSTLAPFARRHLSDAHFNEKAPYLDLTAFKSTADYDARYSSTQKKRRKKIRRALTSRGPLHFALIEDSLERHAAITAAIQEKVTWLNRRGRINRIMDCPRHIAFLQRLAWQADSPLQLVVTKLVAGDKPVSWDIGLRYHDTNYCYITAHDNELDDLSPGRLHMDFSQRLSLTDGLAKFDLMVPNDPHKDSWCSGKIDVNDYYTPFTTKGRLFGFAYLAWLRPLLRKAYYKLPPKALAVLRPIIY